MGKNFPIPAAIAARFPAGATNFWHAGTVVPPATRFHASF